MSSILTGWIFRSMFRSMFRSVLPAALVALLAAVRSPAQDAGHPPPDGAEARREIEKLTARIAELEDAVRAARAAAGRQEPPPAGSVSLPPAALAPTAAVSTAAARDAGARASAGAGDAAAVKVLRDLLARRDAPALTKELGSLLARGEPAHATLHDFLSELDRDSRQALLLSYDYHFSFSLAHLAMLHEAELARFAHYFFAATRSAPASTLRRTLFDFLPVFLRYHRGRYPDLERDLQEEILRRLKDGKGNLQVYYGAMEALGYKPPGEVFDPLLEAASSHAEALPIVHHLEALDDGEAVAILRRNISVNRPELGWKAALMLGALARMTAPEAAAALQGFLYTPHEGLRAAAVHAYLGVPRDTTSLSMVLEFLNADLPLVEKHQVIRRLRSQQPALLEALGGAKDRLPPDVARELLESEGGQPPR